MAKHTITTTILVQLLDSQLDPEAALQANLDAERHEYAELVSSVAQWDMLTSVLTVTTVVDADVRDVDEIAQLHVDGALLDIDALRPHEIHSTRAEG